MKTKEGKNAPKKEAETVNNESAELADAELAQVTGGAINTLTQLSKNQNSLSKSLAKLSSGMKVNSAADDPSGYQISERMRVQIRALDPANYNVQNEKSESEEEPL